MTPEDDPLDGMHRFDRDDELFDRLLDGAVDPDDAPEELAEIAALVRQTGGDAAPGELADEDRLVAAMAAVLPGVADVLERSSSLMGGSTVIHRLLRAKVATVVVVSAVGLGAAAAAVSTTHEGSRSEVEAAETTLVQVTVASTAPTTTSSTTSTTTSTTSTTTSTTTTSTTAAPPTSAGPPVTVDPAIVALCQAWKAGHQTKPPTPPSAELVAAAKAAGKSVDDFCEKALGEKERHDREEADRRERDRRDHEEKDRERRRKEDEDRRRREGDQDGGGDGRDRG
ncbi:MAG TPA: hypothetical protein VID93_08245 [Acidimicrobiales bacterium]